MFVGTSGVNGGQGRSHGYTEPGTTRETYREKVSPKSTLPWRSLYGGKNVVQEMGRNRNKDRCDERTGWEDGSGLCGGHQDSTEVGPTRRRRRLTGPVPLWVGTKFLSRNNYTYGHL